MFAETSVIQRSQLNWCKWIMYEVNFRHPANATCAIVIEQFWTTFSLMQRTGNNIFVIPPVTALCSLDKIRGLVF